MVPPFFKRILVPLDGSAIAEGIVPYAAGLAQAVGAGLVLFQARTADEKADAVEAHLEDVAAELRMKNLGVATDSEQGDPSEAIVDAAHRYEAGLIVMTGHATAAGRKDLLGSTAHAVLSRCTTPVLVLPLSATAYTPSAAVVMGHDGSASASNAVEPSVALARALQCELVLVRAVEPVDGLGGAAKYYSAVDDFAVDDLESLRGQLSATGLPVSTHVGKRLADQEMLGIAGSRRGAIIAVSTTSMSGKPNVLGSTTDRLVRSQTRPVLAVPANS